MPFPPLAGANSELRDTLFYLPTILVEFSICRVSTVKGSSCRLRSFLNCQHTEHDQIISHFSVFGSFSDIFTDKHVDVDVGWLVFSLFITDDDKAKEIKFSVER